MLSDRTTTLADLERAAQAALSPAAWAYLAGGAGSEHSVAANLAAFADVWLRPRAFGGPAPVRTAVELLGTPLSMPVLLAPTSPQRLFHPDAELATARAAVAAGTVATVSSDSHYPFRVISSAVDGRCWFQLYPYQDRATIDATVAMAQDVGAQAVVLTVDADCAARRLSLWRSGFLTPTDVDFGTLREFGVLTGDVPPDGRLERVRLGWHDLDWLRRRTTIPLLVKGILHPDDAVRCVDAGVDGVVVSNHGGRQLDSVVPSLAALGAVAAAVNGRAVVLFDGGIRSGIDVVKALGLGADAVCVGRPHLWGLALAGEEGVRAVLRVLRDELEDALRQLGVVSVAGIDESVVVETSGVASPRLPGT